MIALRSLGGFYDWIVEWLGFKTDSLTEIREFRTSSGDMPVRVAVPAGSEKDRDLPSSWFQRPVLITETGRGADAKTELLLTRSALDLESSDPGPVFKSPVDNDPRPIVLEDKLTVQFLRLERPKPGSFGRPFAAAGMWTCSVTYTVTKPDVDRVTPCRRNVRNSGFSRATPATMLHAAQIVTGRFDLAGGNKIAILDACVAVEPVYLDLDGEGPVKKIVPENAEERARGGIYRTVDCRPDDPEKVFTQMSR